MTHGIFPWIALFTPRWYINHWTSAGRMTRFYLWNLAVSVSLIDAYFATDHCQIICKRVKIRFIKADDSWAPTRGSYLIASIKPAIWLFCSCFLMLSPAHNHYIFIVYAKDCYGSRRLFLPAVHSNILLIKLYKPTPQFTESQ